MEQAILETVLTIVSALAVTLIGVFGAWLTAQIGKNKKLAGINAATEQVIRAAQLTVGELQQTIVDKLKADGAKLSEEQIAILGRKLLTMTREKLSIPTLDLLDATAVDVNALITGAGESWIKSIK